MRVIQTAFWLVCAAVTVASLSPTEYLLPGVFDWWDKAQHAIAFAGLCFCGLWAYPNRVLAMLVGLLLLGAVIEVAQAATGWRVGDVADWVADAVGVGLAYGFFRAYALTRSRAV